MKMVINKDDILTNKANNKFNRILYRNRIVLRNEPYLVRSQKNIVNLNFWGTIDSEWDNVGDYLSYVVVTELCKQLNIDFHKSIKTTKHLYAVGSILLGYQNATIWGSGFGHSRPNNFLRKIDDLFHRIYHRTDIRAVRGPESRKILLQMNLDCPEIYGDPAVLMPLIYRPKKLETIDYLVIPHYSKYESFAGYENVISTFTNDYKSFIDKIANSKLVISSSLHGIILAEAYGVPAIMLKDTPSEDILKYKDWYYSTSRFEFPIADTVESALQIVPSLPDNNVIEEMQKRLLESFPVDLWKD